MHISINHPISFKTNKKYNLSFILYSFCDQDQATYPLASIFVSRCCMIIPLAPEATDTSPALMTPKAPCPLTSYWRNYMTEYARYLKSTSTTFIRYSFLSYLINLFTLYSYSHFLTVQKNMLKNVIIQEMLFHFYSL